MKCIKCDNKAIVEEGFCKEHFVENFETKVFETIKDHHLIKDTDKVLVAASGGKDSLTALYLVKKYHKNVDALIIDEGIKDYREYSYNDLVRFCNEHKINLLKVSFKEEFGKTLDKVIAENPSVNPCTFCGILRRFLMNKYSSKYDVIVTGHNLDDEVQSVMMNILRGNVELAARLGPRTGLNESVKFTSRIKPLYFNSEKDVKIYSFVKGFKDTFVECPYSNSSYRSFLREYINKKESAKRGMKLNIITNFMDILPNLREEFKSESEIQLCKGCGYPARHDLCNTCKTLEKYNLIKLSKE